MYAPVRKVVIQSHPIPSSSFHSSYHSHRTLAASKPPIYRQGVVSHLVEPIFVVVPPGVESLEDARQLAGAIPFGAAAMLTKQTVRKCRMRQRIGQLLPKDNDPLPLRDAIACCSGTEIIYGWWNIHSIHTFSVCVFLSFTEVHS